MYEVDLIINGENVPARDHAVFSRVGADAGAVATIAADAGIEDARAAANAAAATFPKWSTMSDKERARVLIQAAENLEAQVEDFVTVMALETGATEEWARFNCQIAAKMLRHGADMAVFERRSERRGFDKHVTSILTRQPAGVVLGIAPWNAPIVLAARAIAVPLAVGNTMVLKASEICPRTHAMVVEAVANTDAPKGTINLVTNAPSSAAEITEALIAHSAVRRVNFTGSTRVGRLVAETCARHLKPVVLELSGKSPMIVLDDADMDRAVRAAAFGAFFNQGQVCISTERIIIADEIADAFALRLAKLANSMRVGDPTKEKAQLGPMISADAAVRVQYLVEDAVEKGAALLSGGSASKSTVEPTVLDHVDRTMRIYSEESFGPVATLIRVRSEDEAITIANDTDFGLGASVFSQDTERAMQVAEQLECGVCQINGPTVYDDPNMPFGGMKASGYGKLGGQESINEFTELRWIAVHKKEGHTSL